jgi:prepilin peptidase CpaA
MILILIILGPILVVAAATDILYRKIPNWLTFPSIIAGIVFSSYTAGIRGGLLSVAGVLLGMAFYLPFYIKGGTGAGDVKLMGAVGGFLGPKGVFYAFLLSSITGGVYALLLLLLQGMLWETFRRYWYMLAALIVQRKLLYIPPENAARMPVLRYGIAIALGTIGFVLCNAFWIRIS